MKNLVKTVEMVECVACKVTHALDSFGFITIHGNITSGLTGTIKILGREFNNLDGDNRLCGTTILCKRCAIKMLNPVGEWTTMR